MQLQCNSCRQPIQAADVNIDLGIAKCAVCNSVFSFLDKLGSVAAPREIIKLPKRFQVDHWGSELVITKRWFNHGVWALLAFCIFWDGFLVVWYSAGIGMLLRGSKGDGMTWLMLVFPLLHVAVGIGLTYGVLCTFFNKTIIRVAHGELTVSHGPLPCPGNSRHFTSDIKQLFCTEKKWRGEDSVRRTYNVLALKRDDTQAELVTGFENLDEAVFIEQQVEQHLKITDERVPGEAQCQEAVASA
jgi:hypothetical protein